MVGFVERERFREVGRETQELYRQQLAIPDAMPQDLTVAASAPVSGGQDDVAAQTQLVSMRLENYSLGFALAATLVLVGGLACRKTAPLCAADMNSQTRTVAEEAALSKFLEEFRVGPLAPARVPRLGLWSADSTVVAREARGNTCHLESDPVTEVFAGVSEEFVALRRILQEVGRAPNTAAGRKALDDLGAQIHALKERAGLSESSPVRQLASALEGLVRQLTEQGDAMTASALRTIASSVDLLEELCVRGLKAELETNAPLRLLAVDDDRISRHAVSCALKRGVSAPDLAQDGAAALALVNQRRYDVILLDVQMPGMDGFELCSRIHNTGPNRATPVVFVTCQSDFNARAQSTLSGGHDLIGKPFLPFEVAVKVLTFALRGRCQSLTNACG